MHRIGITGQLSSCSQPIPMLVYLTMRNKKKKNQKTKNPTTLNKAVGRTREKICIQMGIKKLDLVLVD